MNRKKPVKSKFYIWDESAPGMSKLKGDIRSAYKWYKKRKKKKR